jgi:flagellar protein FliS
MNPHLAYKQQRSFGWARIDMLLALYERALERLDQARTALAQADVTTAGPFLVDAQLLVSGLVSGVNLDYGDLPLNFLRLYEFVLHNLRAATVEKVEDAMRILNALREGLRAIRAEAVQLERKGEIPPLEATLVVEATA